MAETTVKMDDFGMFFAVLALHSFLFSEQLGSGPIKLLAERAIS